ncbi:MAG: trypsin-like peptidase domain-containing protein [Cyanobacteria bacterium P01_H01_bin.15]
MPALVLNAPVQAQAPAESILSQITVRIIGPSSGSGVLVERVGDRYFVVTNTHVVRKPGSYGVVLPNGDRVPIPTAQIQPIPDHDFAILSFSSKEIYPVAAIAKEAPQVGDAIFVAGWPRSGGSLRQSVFTSTQGELTTTEAPLPQGYRLTYTNLVRTGMSGGPILNAKGELIGINGLVRLAGQTSQVVASGLPIDIYQRWRQVNLPPATPQLTANPQVSSTDEPPILKRSLSGEIHAIANTKNTLVTTDGGNVRLWQLADLTEETNWNAHQRPINDLAIAASRSLLATASEDGTAKLWNLETGKLLQTLTGHYQPVTGVEFSADGQTVITSSWDRTLKVWSVATGELRQEITGHDAVVSAIAIIPGTPQVISGSTDGTIRRWNWQTGQALGILGKHKLAVLSLSINANGTRLLSGGGEGMIQAWQVSDGKNLGSWAGHQDGVWALDFTQNGFVSGSWDRSVRVWRWNHKTAIATFRDHKSYIGAVWVGADQQLISGDWQGVLLRRLLNE